MNRENRDAKLAFVSGVIALLGYAIIDNNIFDGKLFKLVNMIGLSLALVGIFMTFVFVIRHWMNMFDKDKQ